MVQARKIGAKHYYEYLPDPRHRCGDIWSGLPTHGLLGSSNCRGLVITPACDLANKKAETIIYLPVVPLRAYFSTIGVLPEIKVRLEGLLKAGKLDLAVNWAPSRYYPPTEQEIDRVADKISIHLVENQRGQKEINALKRAAAGLEILRRVAAAEYEDIDPKYLTEFFGSDWNSLKIR